MKRFKLVLQNQLLTKVAIIVMFIFNIVEAQTIENPIDITVKPVNSVIRRGETSALEITFKIPKGFWLGDNNSSSRMPPPIVIQMEENSNFIFEKPLFPKASVEGVPVKKGITRVYKEEIKVIVPFKVVSSASDGNHQLKVFITYTPGLNAGRLTTHVKEKYFVNINIDKNTSDEISKIPEPSISSVPTDFIVREEITKLPEPLNTILYRWPEDSFVAEFLHWIWIDPENHGKHVQTVFTPYYGFTENNGYTAGMGMSLMDLTREGIMTGQVQLRGFYNEYVGATLGFEAVSCPAAYHNYWISGFLSSNGKNRGINFHIENLNFGGEHNLGYELFADFFRDPRYRFYGVGADTKEEDKTNYTHQENSVLLDIFWMPVDKIRFTIGGKVRNVDVLDGNDKIRNIMPWTTDFTNQNGKFKNIPGIKGATVYGGRVSILYDGRNSEFTPSAGFYGRITAEFNRISDQVVTSINPVENYGKFYVDLREYISTADQRFTLLLRNSWTLTTDENIPFFEQAKLGGDFSNRAFDNGRFYGQHSVFASMELRIQTMSIVFMGVPMDLEMAPFLDAGQVFTDAGFKGRFNVNPGMSIRILNRPNLGIVGNAAVGQDGLILTGGVTLPF